MISTTAFFGHKRVWWLQSGGTVWNKCGISHGTSGVMHWNRFWGNGGHWGRHRAPKGFNPEIAKNCDLSINSRNVL